MKTIDINSAEFKAMPVTQQARLIWEGMKARNPERGAQIEKSVKRRVDILRAELKINQMAKLN